MEQTSLIKLPYIMPAQAQKHVTHNEALRILDAILHIRVEEIGRAAPPQEPAEGERYVVGEAPQDAFEGQAGRIAAFQDGAWAFHTPAPGWTLWDAAEGVLRVFDGEGWSGVSASGHTLPVLGVNTEADETNRFAVRAEATLLTHEGAGHQLKINKAEPRDTASLLFQTGWSGRAEMGIAGNDAFSVKVSVDGSQWRTALSAAAETGYVGIGTDAPTTALDVEGTVRSSVGFRIGEAILQNGANAMQLATSSHFSTSGLLAVGTTPIANQSIRIRMPDASPARRAIYAYGHVNNSSDGNPLFVVRGDAAVGIGTASPQDTAALDVTSTERGFLPPRMTSAQRNAIASPAEGLMIYNTTERRPQFWNGTAWVGLG